MLKRFIMKNAVLSFLFAALLVSGCADINLKLFSGKTDPLQEFVLSGSVKEKVLIIPVDGMISNYSDFSVLKEHAGMLESIISQLRCAEKDKDIKAIVLKVNSPGGLVTESDILYNELLKLKKKTGKKLVVSMMDIATSGAYMISLPADLITAHPTTVTGSVGVVFMRPKITGLMDKIGVSVDISKSGKNKDMGSPFKKASKEDDKLFQDVVDRLSHKFFAAVRKHRKISDENMEEVKTARIFLADKALKIGLIDKICYLDDAIKEAEKLAGLKKARVVIYRREYYPNDNLYNNSMSYGNGEKTSLVNLGVLQRLGSMKAGFYSIWEGCLPGENRY